MGTRQGDPLGGALFALAYFRALHSTTSHFLSCLVPSIANDTHIVAPLSIDHFHMNTSRRNFMRYVFLSNVINV
jgi:hypothetical protein